VGVNEHFFLDLVESVSDFLDAVFAVMRVAVGRRALCSLPSRGLTGLTE
jgi:hypothetical protein